MADNVKSLMAGLQADPSAFQVSGHLLTNIQVQAGDEVSISASGIVQFGLLAGRGDPNGIQGFEDYSYFPNVNHGALLARVRRYGTEDWVVIGTGKTFVANSSGQLELLLNDADPDNNVGYFVVKVTVRYRR